MLERACGHGQLILLILCRRNFQIVTFQLIHLFAERIALLGLFLAVLFLLLFLLLCIGKLLLQLLDLLFLVIGQRIIICQRIQLAAGGIVLFIIQIALCLVQIGVELIVRLGRLRLIEQILNGLIHRGIRVGDTVLQLLERRNGLGVLAVAHIILGRLIVLDQLNGRIQSRRVLGFRLCLLVILERLVEVTAIHILFGHDEVFVGLV